MLVFFRVISCVLHWYHVFSHGLSYCLLCPRSVNSSPDLSHLFECPVLQVKINMSQCAPVIPLRPQTVFASLWLTPHSSYLCKLETLSPCFSHWSSLRSVPDVCIRALFSASDWKTTKDNLKRIYSCLGRKRKPLIKVRGEFYLRNDLIQGPDHWLSCLSSFPCVLTLFSSTVGKLYFC